MNKEVLDKMAESLVAIGEILTTPGASQVDSIDEKLVKEAMHSPDKARDPHVKQTCCCICKKTDKTLKKHIAEDEEGNPVVNYLCKDCLSSIADLTAAYEKLK